MSNQEQFESDYDEQENQEPTLNIEQFKHLQEVLNEMKKVQLIEGTDYIIKMFTDKKSGKKTPKAIMNASGIKKLAFAFEVSTEIVGPKEGTQIHVPPEYGLLPGEKVPSFVLAWKYEVRASFLWPPRTGVLRWAENNGGCSSNEDRSFGKGENAPHGRPVHDVIAIALTRAIGRAILSLLGGGLSSAEITMKELQAQNQSFQSTLRTTQSLSAPQQNLNPLPTRETSKKNQFSTLRTS